MYYIMYYLSPYQINIQIFEYCEDLENPLRHIHHQCFYKHKNNKLYSTKAGTNINDENKKDNLDIYTADGLYKQLYNDIEERFRSWIIHVSNLYKCIFIFSIISS